MTDETPDPSGSGESSRKRPEWVDEAEDALERIGDAVKAAWAATRESRVSALDSAKEAARQLGEANRFA